MVAVKWWIDNCPQVKFVYVASLDDQVVPVSATLSQVYPFLTRVQIYSGIFTSVNHPQILRALYIDGDAYRYGF